MSGDKLGHQCTEVCHCVILGKKKRKKNALKFSKEVVWNSLFHLIVGKQINHSFVQHWQRT